MSTMEVSVEPLSRARTVSLPGARLAAALVAAQRAAQASAVGRDGVARDQGGRELYRYQRSGDLVAAGARALAGAGLALVVLGRRVVEVPVPGREVSDVDPRTGEARVRVEGGGTRLELELEVVLVHESGEERAWATRWAVAAGNRMMGPEKVLAAAGTGAVGRIYRDLLAIPTDEDDERTERAEPREEQRAPAREPERARPTPPQARPEPQASAPAQPPEQAAQRPDPTEADLLTVMPPLVARQLACYAADQPAPTEAVVAIREWLTEHATAGGHDAALVGSALAAACPERRKGAALTGAQVRRWAHEVGRRCVRRAGPAVPPVTPGSPDVAAARAALAGRAGQPAAAQAEPEQDQGDAWEDPAQGAGGAA